MTAVVNGSGDPGWGDARQSGNLSGMRVRLHHRALTLGGEGHEGDVAGTFDRRAELALVSGTIAGDTARNDLATLGDQIAQALNILIIDIDDLICTEPAYFLTRKAPFCRHR